MPNIEARDVTGYNHVRIVVVSCFGHGGGVVLVNKEQAYQELISDVKNYYKAQEAEHKDEAVYLTWYDDCEEINLWTY